MGFNVGNAGVGRQLPDLLCVVALVDQVGDELNDLVEAIPAVLNGELGVALYAEFLRRDALDFGESLFGKLIDAQKTSQQDTNRLIQSTNEGFTAKLAANAGEAPTSLADNTVKYITIASALVGLILLFRPGNSKN